MGEAFEESDLRAGLRDGGQVLGAFIVARSEEEFVIYMRASWGRGRGFRIVRTWRGASGDRTFKNLQSAWCFVRKFEFSGRVTVYPLGDGELRQFVGVNPQDMDVSPQVAGSTRNMPEANFPDAVRLPALDTVQELFAAGHLPGHEGNPSGSTSPKTAKSPATS